MIDISFFDKMSVFTHAKIPLDVIPVAKDVVNELYPHPERTQFAHYKVPIDKVSSEFSAMLHEVGLDVKHAEIFFRPGVGKLMDAFIHTDSHTIVPGFAKINFVYGGSNNVMRWWKPTQVTSKNHMLTPIGTRYLHFDESECVMLDEVMMDGLYVVNAGIPHSVLMGSASVDNPRVCISVTPRLYGSEATSNVGCRDTVARLMQLYS